ncbi:MAG: 3-deoxy-D-manno-octulosonic acid transferase, partial [bacterium]|nr:3-deoxy-D-manno-octulosonic acid transferase [bacterium]
MHFIYRFLTHVAKPFLPGYLERRTRRGKEDRARLIERYGRPTISRPEGHLIWIHAASVGESKSVLSLVRELLRAHPSLSVLVTTGTKSSAQLMADQLPERAFHQYIPLDVTQWVQDFLEVWNPCLALWVESEFWPNTLLEIKRRDIPLILLN